jgi:hypothetical protein
MSNTLVVFLNIGDNPPVMYGLIPTELLEKYTLDKMERKIVNHNAIGDVADEIVDLFHRVGMDQHNSEKADLEDFLVEKVENTMIDRVLTIGWAI